MRTSGTERDKRDGRELPPEKVESIIEARLAGMTLRAVAAAVGVDKDTVSRYWHEYLDATANDRSDHLERRRAEIVGRLWQNANNARRMLDHADNPAPPLTAEQRTLATIGEFLGMKQLNISGNDGRFRLPTDEEATALLAKLPNR